MNNDLNILNFTKLSDDDEEIISELKRINLNSVDKIIINEFYLNNRYRKIHENVNEFLLAKHLVSEGAIGVRMRNYGGYTFRKKHPNFYRSKPHFCDKDKFITKKILEKLGNPQKRIGPVIHITGSNGKGSTATFIERIFMENGYKANKFTSPSIIRSNENIMLNDRAISSKDYYRINKKVKLAYDELISDDSFIDEVEEIFENEVKIGKISNKKGYMGVADWSFIIPITMLSFLENKADVNIIEVVNGGLKDFTNIFTEDEIMAVIITYTQYGIGSNDGTMRIQDEKGKWVSSNKATAYHKSMLSRKNRPVIVANQTPDVLEEIRRVSELNEAYTVEYSRDWFIKNETETDFVFEGLGKEIKIEKSKILLEECQNINIATAVATVFSQNKYKIKESSIQKAVNSMRIVGRLQYVNDGYYKKYLGGRCSNVISGIMKFNDSAMESIEKVISKLEGNVYIIYTTSNKKTEGENVKFFKKIREHKNVKLIIYEKSTETFDILIKEAEEADIEYQTAPYLSMALKLTKSMLVPNENNNVIILCNSMNRFDKNIVFLDKI